MKIIDKLYDLYDKIEDWVYEDDSTNILKTDKIVKDISKNEEKVKEIEDDKETIELADSTKKKIFFIGTSVLAAAIIFASTQTESCNKQKAVYIMEQDKSIENTEEEVTQEVENTKETTIESESATENTEEIQEENNKSMYKQVDYSNAETFYNHILENRNSFGEFAESFQSIDDVKNLINFKYNFDEMYQNEKTTIDSREFYDEIIRDYFKSCQSHDIKGELHLLYKEGSLAYNKLKEAEDLTYDLKNGVGNDYTIANNYYTWLGKNLCDRRTAITQNMKNATLIEDIREQYEIYRNSGNMLEARKYQKNDSLSIDPIEIYYAYQFPEGTDVTAMNNSFSCPDWGIDNIVSKYEETTETQLVERIDNREIFNTVTEAFDTVLNKNKTR